MTRLLSSLAAAALCAGLAFPAYAQGIPVTKDALPAVTGGGIERALEILRADNDWTLAQQISLCEIPAPPFKEAVRAAEYRRRMDALGLRNTRIDAVGNVLGERPGTGSGPTVVISGHLDTVFPEGTDVRTKREGGRILGPGIGDDCRGLAVVLAVARAFRIADVQLPGTVVFVGTVGEEGAGNLRGMRHLYAQELRGRADYFISVDGSGLNAATSAVGSNRYTVTYKGPGGHSYGAFGIPNPVHALGRAIAGFADLQVPTSPRTTFNVGVIRGGTSVNSISFEASMDIDMRSESAESLADLDARAQRVFREALDAEHARWGSSERARAAQLSLVIDTIGLRPAGTQSDTALIVRTAVETGRSLGFTPQTHASSTDANVPIGLGLPGITIGGGGRGGGAHSLNEWYEDGDRGWVGPQWAATLVHALAGAR